MSTLVVKNLPEPLHDKLREQAQANRRSVTQEVIHILENGVQPVRPRKPIKLAPLIRLKGGPLTIEQIEAAIAEGRE